MQDAEGTASRAHANHQGVFMPRKTAVRRTRTVAVASLIAAAAVSLTACGGGDTATGAQQGPSSAATPIHPGGTPTVDPDPGGTPTIDPGGSSGGTGGSTGGSGKAAEAKAGSASDGSSSARRCTSGHLKAAWSSFEGGPDMDYDGQQTARVVLTNTGTTGCTLAGFSGVQFQTSHGSTWDLRRSNKKPESVRLDAGGKAVFDITFLASTREDDRKFAPNQVVITPPNERRNIVLDWPYGGALLDQSGATRPGTFVGPVTTTE
ncbi:hypothetical protein GCM10010361_33070 [Streptomyces olivaceiscleroticus]|uniref:DUF4232 domain-containing protein n=2 Tax=Streptomyces olivaceiscleroticus TaxID=68245 RepID=A0ABN1A304_9ACTN